MNGFSLELIHRDSIHSPLYPGNLTETERFHRNLENDRFHVERLNASVLRPDELHPIITYENSLYMVKVGIGQPPKKLHLALDTSSSIIWTQCNPCHSCFQQIDPLFNPRESYTYRLIHTGHPLCYLPADHSSECPFEFRHFTEATATGFLGQDQFTAKSMSSYPDVVRDVVFGCAHQSAKPDVFNDKLSGFLAMGRGRGSFMNQLPRSIPRRFSYCLTRPDEHGSIGHLQIGFNLRRRMGDTIRFLESSPNDYHLDLRDISLNRRRLRLPPGTFSLHEEGRGGFSINTGLAITLLVRPAYDALKSAVIEHFNGDHNVRATDGHRDRMELCYLAPSGFRNFPAMTLHFPGGGKLGIHGVNLFGFVSSTEFCLFVLPDDRYSILGAYAMANNKFVFDLDTKQVSVSPQDCSRN